MKKYLIVTPMFPMPNSFRGPFLTDQAHAIQKSGRYDVVVFKSAPLNQKADPYTYDGIPVIQFHDFIPFSGALSNVLWPLGAVNFTVELEKSGIRLEDVAVCHTHGVSLIPLLNYLKRRNPDIVTAAQFHYSEHQWGRLGQFGWLRNYLCQNSAKLTALTDVSISVSAYSFATLNIRGRHHYTLYNGVDLNKFYSVPGLRDAKTFHIGCVGNFIPLKDQMTLLRAAEKLLQNGMVDLKVSFVGSGPTLNECKKYAENTALSGHVHFRSEVDHSELNSFYNSLDLFILPSYCEAFGCVYLEASACGVPFMGCLGQGIEEFISEPDKDKWLIQPRSWEDLAIKIADFRKNSWKQELNYPIDIQWHVGRYLDYLEETFEMK